MPLFRLYLRTRTICIVASFYILLSIISTGLLFRLKVRKSPIRSGSGELEFQFHKALQQKLIDVAEDDIRDDSWQPWGKAKAPELPDVSVAGVKWEISRDVPVAGSRDFDVPEQGTVEIWSKVGVGIYLWRDVLGQNMSEVAGGYTGSAVIAGTHFRFRHGRHVTLTSVPRDARRVILALNGRDAAAVSKSRPWLELLETLPHLRAAAAVVLGDERCRNGWAVRGVRRGGQLSSLFLVYDSPDIDDSSVLPFPLGVATYRGFPGWSPSDSDARRARPHVCSFSGTVYSDTSRQLMVETIQRHNLSCLLRTRESWIPSETELSLQQYMDDLRSSDLVLSPAGRNPECYRLYEAMQMGAVPVILKREGREEGSRCLGNSLALLKAHGLPAIVLDSWDQLKDMLARERSLSPSAIVSRRRRVLQWYTDFRRKLRDHFLSRVNATFFL